MKPSEVLKVIGNSFPHPITLVDVNLPDQPLVYVNQAFSNLTQYSYEEVIGKNCRFLQGALTDPEAVLRIRQAITLRNPICQDLLNYNKQNEIFYNRLVLIPLREGNAVYYLGLQHEMAQAQFKKVNEVGQNELLDKTNNPLTIIMSSFAFPEAEGSGKRMIESMTRIRGYVLSL